MLYDEVDVYDPLHSLARPPEKNDADTSDGSEIEKVSILSSSVLTTAH